MLQWRAMIVRGHCPGGAAASLSLDEWDQLIVAANLAVNRDHQRRCQFNPTPAIRHKSQQLVTSS